jgi:hypothetical protein
MAVPTGTFTKYAAVGIKEDLQDMVYDISPTETPFMTNIGRGKARATYHEWQTDSLAAASAANKHIEGDDDATNTASPTTRLGNYTQIMKKVPRVSGTMIAVDTAGRRDEMSYQISKRSQEIKRDIEACFCGTQAAAVGTAAGARASAGLGAWLWNNQTKKGAAATTVAVSSGAPTTAPTAGTAGTFTEANLKSTIAACWEDGGSPTMVLVGSHNKQLASAFGGIATQYRDNPQTGPGVIIGAADVYVSDFGQLNIVASRFTTAANVFVLDLEYWEAGYLRPISQKPLAKTGDSERREILCEVTLVAKNPASSGKVYTTTTS